MFYKFIVYCLICWKHLTMPYKHFCPLTVFIRFYYYYYFCFISLLFNFLRGFLLIQILGLKSYVLLLINVISLLIILEDCYAIMKKHWIYLWIWPFFAVTIMHILQIRFVTVKRKKKNCVAGDRNRDFLVLAFHLPVKGVFRNPKRRYSKMAPNEKFSENAGLFLS